MTLNSTRNVISMAVRPPRALCGPVSTAWLLHNRMTIRVNFVDLTQIERTDSRLHLAHVPHNYPDQVVRQDHVLSNGVCFRGSHCHDFGGECLEIVLRQVVFEDGFVRT